ncbi:DUF262 domain-containing protein [Sphingobacterium sp. xlx-130]|uniref:DUF262 domain-containing protein n=1 Tax=Sphingobacterium sp. xlx-130 TaxID=2654323 RepID=UPI0013DBE0CC|nr:DUF262 domain-containing protein [Sphingobacterium sp. xlx-130]
MKSGSYNLKSLLTHNEIDQFIIPELQRDYVWGEQQVQAVWDSIFNNYERKLTEVNQFKISYVNNSEQFEDYLLDHLQEQVNLVKFSQKFGFIYAYHDKEFPGRFFLIDGQQRLTTFFLLLLALYIKAGKTEEFRKLYFQNEMPIVDYKVRESAYDFLRLFLRDVLAGRDFEQNINYFHRAYENDVTVSNIKNNYNLLQENVEKIASNVDVVNMIDYIENYIEFNYFDTNLSEQGEKLYLYMNSRGESLSFQERLRAKIIQKSSDKIEAGKKWEVWQNYFFEKSSELKNADSGFEWFLYMALIVYKSENSKLLDEDIEKPLNDRDAEAKFKIVRKHKSEQEGCLDIKLLDRLFNALELYYQSPSKGIYRYQPSDFLKGKTTIITLYRVLLPVYYRYLFPDVTESIAEQFDMFILNESHTQSVGNKTSENLVWALDFVKRLTQPDVLDPVNNMVLKDFLNQSFEHEFQKLTLLNDGGTSNGLKTFLYTLYSDLGYNKFLEGRTDILFEMAKYCSEQSGVEVDLLYKVKKAIAQIFAFDGEKWNLRSHELRRYLMTFYDFSNQDGYSHSRERWTWVRDDRTWLNRVLASEDFKEKVLSYWLDNSIDNRADDYITRLSSLSKISWEYYICQYPTLFDMCRDYCIAWSHDKFANSVLMKGVAASWADIYVACKLFTVISKEKSYEFSNYGLNVCYIDLKSKAGNIFPAESEDSTATIELHYREELRWDIAVYYRNGNVPEIIKTLGWVHMHEDTSIARFVKIDFSFDYSSSLDLESNTLAFYAYVEKLIGDLGREGVI